MFGFLLSRKIHWDLFGCDRKGRALKINEKAGIAPVQRPRRNNRLPAVMSFILKVTR